MSELPQSIALFRLSAIGDVLMFLPTVRALLQAFPKARLSWIISNPAYQLVKDIKGVNFIVIEKPRRFKDYWYLYQRLSTYRFDVLLACQASLRAHLIYPMIKAKRKIGYDNIRSQEGHRFFVSEQIPFAKVHTLEGFLQFANYLGADTSRVSWDVPIDDEAKLWVAQQLATQHLDKGPLVLINAATSKAERCWAASNYPKIITYLRDTYQANVILCGGPGALDRQLADDISKEIHVVDWVGKTRLPQLMALVEQANLVISPDTGTAHMASAVGTPAVVLHAVTKPQISGAYGQLQHAVDKYPEAKRRYHSSKIGDEGRDWFEKVHHPEVMQLISHEDVVEKIDAVLGLLPRII